MPRLKRVIAHWTAGGYTANSVDKAHYHFIVNGDGTIVHGRHRPEANIRIQGDSSTYAAHTARKNTGSIGISMACMRGASTDDFGASPMTEQQFEAMCAKIAQLCDVYEIPITPTTVLSHAEVQPVLGVRQKAKWDFTVLPFKPGLRGWKACGDYMRERVLSYSAEIGDDPDVEPPEPVHVHDVQLYPGMSGNLVKDLQAWLNNNGFHCGRVDGQFGDETAAAVLRCKRENGLDTSDETITLRELLACNPRRVSEQRRTATEADVVEQSETARQAKAGKRSAITKMILGVLTSLGILDGDKILEGDLLEKGKALADKAQQGKDLYTQSQDTIERLTGGLIDMRSIVLFAVLSMVAIAVVSYWKHDGVLRRRIRDYRIGKNL